ncbi:type II toxin-antitoxin system HicB family antitoxin [Pediococcus damnosus]|uniref:type II toxin-antitoxin system HicB family antitoxin n=1 Tax=Pediococcus damnosus TaxID=51663 RepID=UPI003F6CD972
MTYPALITPDEHNTYDIEFVDIPEALSFGNSINDAVIHGQEALGLALYSRKPLPAATAIENINKEDNQMIVIVSVDLNIIKSQVKEPTIHKNVTVPADLAEQAQQQGINFSATLSDALREKLDI